MSKRQIKIIYIGDGKIFNVIQSMFQNIYIECIIPLMFTLKIFDIVQ